MNIEFNYRMMKFECTCGQPELKVKVGINNQCELVCRWKCGGCGKPVMALLPLSKLVEDCVDIPDTAPDEEENEQESLVEKPEPKLLTTQSDHDFLKSFGIRDEDDGA